MPSLPVPFLFPGELLTQSMWNTASPEVRISEKVGRKRTLSLSSSLSLSCLTLTFTANSNAQGRGCISHNVPAEPHGLSGGYCGQPDTHREEQISGSPRYLQLSGKLGLSGDKIQVCWGLIGSRLRGRNHTPSFSGPQQALRWWTVSQGGTRSQSVNVMVSLKDLMCPQPGSLPRQGIRTAPLLLGGRRKMGSPPWQTSRSVWKLGAVRPRRGGPVPRRTSPAPTTLLP